MRNRLIVLGVLVLLLTGGLWLLRSRFSAPGPLAIAAAADLRFALPDLIEKFKELHPQLPVEATFGSSGSFFAQIRNHAPFDLFLSADLDYPRQLVEQDLATQQDLFRYGRGHLVVWALADSPLPVAKQGLQVFLDPRITKIAIANPRFAPYGRAAKAALETENLYDKVRDRLVLGDNISQTAQLVQSGAADVGILSLSLALAPSLHNGQRAAVPDRAYPALEQAGLILKTAKDRSSAQAFRDFLLGDVGQAILQRHGFSPPEQ